MRLPIHSFIVALFFLSVFFAGCETSEEGSPPSLNLDALLQEGKAHLAAGDGAAARDRFLLAQTIDPENADAAFGIVLSDMLLSVTLAGGVLEFIQDSLADGSLGGDGTGDPIVFPQTIEEPGIGDTIQKYLHSIFDPVASEMAENLVICQLHSDFRFEIDRVTLWFANEEFYAWEGPWDGDDLYWVDGVVRLVRAFLFMVYSADLNFDARHFTSIDFDVAEVGLLGILDDFLEALFFMFHDPRYPDFLTNTDQAETLMPPAGLDFGFLFHDLVDMQRSVEQGWNDPLTGIWAFEDENDNGIKDPEESFTYNGKPIPDFIEELLPELNAIAWNLRASFFDGTVMDVDFTQPNYWNAADLNLLIKALTGIEFPIIPDIYVDLGGFFTDPDLTALKETIAGVLYCAHNEKGVLDALGCMRFLWD